MMRKQVVVSALMVCACFVGSLPAEDAPKAEGWVRSAKSGPWSAPATWEGGKVPEASAKVQIRPAHAVVYDVRSDEPIRIVHVAGTLRFATDRETRLVVGLLKIQPGELCSEDGFDCDAQVAERKPGDALPRCRWARQSSPSRPSTAR
jgi:hypothetical protein